MRDLSVAIPARNEEFLRRTIEDVLANSEADTEVIAICDGYWPDPPIEDHPRVTIVHHTEAIGQRAATNEAARISQAKYIMKADAHCAFGPGFDRILIEDCQPDWTMIPQLYNLHVFDWKCKACGDMTYQGVEPKNCKKCLAKEGFERVMLWKPRDGKGPYVSWRFNEHMEFKQWRKHARRPEAQGDLVETLSFAGPCFFIHRDRYWELGGCDEAHGSWGQFGTEWACKSWLSGGKLVTTRKTWFAHLFRTGNFRGSGWNGGSFPYPLPAENQEYAREYSRDLWLNDKWEGAKHPLSWLIDKFKPVPGWHEN
ncbi:MAG: glycosyltransferase family 2 protein [Planctomycetota bacterium]